MPPTLSLPPLMVMMAVLLAIIAALTGGPRPALALYADQAGLNDWLVQNVGLLTAAKKHENSFFVGSKQGAIACLNAKNGKIQWRNVLPAAEGHVLDLEIFPQLDVLATLSTLSPPSWSSNNRTTTRSKTSGDLVVRGWNMKNGGLEWEFTPVATAKSTPTFSTFAKARFVQDSASSSSALLIHTDDGNVYRLDPASGKVIWSDTTGSVISFSFSTSDGSLLDVVTTPSSRVISVRRVEAATGKRGKGEDGEDTTAITVPNEEASHVRLLYHVADVALFEIGDSLVALDTKKKRLEANLTGLTPILTTTTLAGIPGGGVQVVFENGTNNFLTLRGVNTNLPSFTWAMPQPMPNPPPFNPLKVFLFGPQSLIQFHNGSLHLYSEDWRKIYWRRDREGLAEAIQLESAPLQRRLGREEGEPGVTRRLRMQLSHIWASVSAMVGEVGTLADYFAGLVRFYVSGTKTPAAIRTVTAEELEFFGFSRVLLALTSTHTLFALDSETGETIWAYHLGEVFFERFARGDVRAAHRFHPRLFVTASPEASGIKHETVVVLDVSTGDAIWFDAQTGRELARRRETGEGRGYVAHAILLPKSRDLAVISHHLPTAARARLVMMPHTEAEGAFPDPSGRHSRVRLEPSPHLHVAPDPLHVHIVSRANNTVTGYLQENGTSLRETWSMSFPPDVTLLTHAAPHSPDPVSSPARALGDQFVLIKHINPALVALFTLHRTLGLTVLLVDSVTGRVVQRHLHRELTAVENFLAVRFEHWLVYCYWNPRTKRTELTSHTLYERILDRRALNPWSSLPKGLQGEPFSSYDYAQQSQQGGGELMSFSRSFFLANQQQRVTALEVTRTMRGIATKNLLLAFEGTGQLAMLDQRFVDPRRTSNPPTEEEKLEGLFQYSPELPVIPTHVLSYHRGVARGARLIHVAPARLESTCLVAASGLDLFMGRAHPSGTFDLLAEDFNYSLLTLLMIGLGGGVLILKRMERRKAIKEAWM